MKWCLLYREKRLSSNLRRSQSILLLSFLRAEFDLCVPVLNVIRHLPQAALWFFSPPPPSPSLCPPPPSFPLAAAHTARMPRPGGGRGNRQKERSCSTSAKCRRSGREEVKDGQNGTDRRRMRRRDRAARSVPAQMADWPTGSRCHCARRLQEKKNSSARLSSDLQLHCW